VSEAAAGDSDGVAPTTLPALAPLSIVPQTTNGCLIEASWLVHGRHGTSLVAYPRSSTPQTTGAGAGCVAQPRGLALTPGGAGAAGCCCAVALEEGEDDGALNAGWLRWAAWPRPVHLNNS
jgi:hypothetical protein